MWADISTIAISVVAIILSVVSLLWQERMSRRGLSYPLVLDFIEEFRDERFKATVELCLNPGQPTREARADGHVHQVLQPEYQDQIRPVLEYFDKVGVLVVDGVLSAERVYSLMGATALRVWRAQAPYIVARREHRAAGKHGSMLYSHFEHLSVQLSRVEGRDLRSRLGLERSPVDSCFEVPAP